MKIVRGKIYQLWKHRLMCGDATNQKDVAKLMMSKKADMVFTDPPYNANYISKSKGGILNDAMSAEDFAQFLSTVNAMLFHYSNEWASLYECINRKNYPILAEVLKRIFRHKSLIVWNKNSFGMGWHYRPKYELVCFCIKWKKPKTWNGGFSEMDVWDISRVHSSRMIHPTEKPLELCKRAIINSSNEGDIVLDLFGWSGTTLIACEELGRRCFMVELDNKYIWTILKRYWELKVTTD